MTVHIFLDMDGVLVDFYRWAQETGKFGPNGRARHDELDYDWWVSIPECQGARAFYDAAVKLGTVNFLTAPVYTTDCFAGKAQWVQNFLSEEGKWAMKHLIIADKRNKALLARPDRILIDDKKENIDAWIAAGGIGIHHKGDFAETLKQLQEAVAKLAPPSKKPQPPGLF